MVKIEKDGWVTYIPDEKDILMALICPLGIAIKSGQSKKKDAPHRKEE